VFVHAYHEATKHHFHRFAASLGYLDWATQPDPFRRFAGARVDSLPRVAFSGEAPYGALFDASLRSAAIADDSVAEFLRCSMGLSAWKQAQRSRWALRVNPSSGNLHPTEAYVVREGRVCHYAPREHAIEERCRLGPAWSAFAGNRAGFLVALTSIHWREAWKYGERAFRYCQHDTGHAIAALRLAAALLGWHLSLLPTWSSDQIAALTGTDRDEDYQEAEREEPECLALVTPAGAPGWKDADPSPLVDAARRAEWFGKANRLSSAHVEWPAIDRVAEATRQAGAASRLPGLHGGTPHASSTAARRRFAPAAVPPADSGGPDPGSAPARAVILQRRSAVAFDGRSSLPRSAFMAMLRRLRPRGAPWDALYWPPQVHLVLFVHRVEGLVPGIYAYLRSRDALTDWRAGLRPEFLWEPVSDANDSSNGNDPTDLFLLAPLDVAFAANRVSCDQDIASDGFFSLGMIARFDASLAEYGEWFYRALFWECGMIGQVLYLEAEAARARGTGIGCFYDDAVHEMAGLKGTTWQSLYHFSMGVPVDDPRLTTEPGYEWEQE
jgi:SagB-type dehydrogenase family enzyme